MEIITNRAAQYFDIKSKDVISPTPAGTKNNAMFLVRAPATGWTLCGLIQFIIRDKNKRTIPQTLPGIQP